MKRCAMVMLLGLSVLALPRSSHADPGLTVEGNVFLALSLDQSLDPLFCIFTRDPLTELPKFFVAPVESGPPGGDPEFFECVWGADRSNPDIPVFNGVMDVCTTDVCVRFELICVFLACLTENPLPPEFAAAMLGVMNVSIFPTDGPPVFLENKLMLLLEVPPS